MWDVGVGAVEEAGAGAGGVELGEVAGLPVGDGEGVFGAVGGGRGVGFYPLGGCGGVLVGVGGSALFGLGRSLQVCVVSLRMRNGERSRGRGGGADCEGVVARAVERQRVQVLCWGNCRSSRFQQVDGRSVGAVEAMAGDVSVM